ncbi:hypothetical protein FKM82_013087 [Ascaphus truei]
MKITEVGFSKHDAVSVEYNFHHDGGKVRGAFVMLLLRLSVLKPLVIIILGTWILREAKTDLCMGALSMQKCPSGGIRPEYLKYIEVKAFVI